MQVTVSRISPVEVSLRVVLSKEKVDAELDRAFLKLGRDAQIRGFRKGKVPRPVLKQYFGGQVASDVFRKLIDQTLPDAIRDQKLEVIGQPQVQLESDILSTAEWAYTAQVEIRPDMSGIDLGALKLTRKVYTISDSALDLALEQKREENATLRTPDPMRPALETDTATFDVAILVDGSEIAEFGARGRTVELGRNTLIKEIDEGLRTMSPGETREVPVTFPETHRQRELAGKTGSFRLTLTTIQEKVLPELDDEFAKDVGAESLEALKASTLATMQKQFADRSDDDVREEAIKRLVEANTIPVPPSLVTQVLGQLRPSLLRELGGTLGEGTDLETTLRGEAEQRVRAGLLLTEVARTHGIGVTEADLNARLEEMAKETGRALPRLRAEYRDQQKRDLLISEVLEKKVLDLLLSKATITDVPTDSSDVDPAKED
jgi:trigger factor